MLSTLSGYGQENALTPCKIPFTDLLKQEWRVPKVRGSVMAEKNMKVEFVADVLGAAAGAATVAAVTPVAGPVVGHAAGAAVGFGVREGVKNDEIREAVIDGFVNISPIGTFRTVFGF